MTTTNPIQPTPEQLAVFAAFDSAMQSLYERFQEANPEDYGTLKILMHNFGRTNYNVKPYRRNSRPSYTVETQGRKGEAETLEEAMEKCFMETEIEIAQRKLRELKSAAKEQAARVRRLARR